MTSQSTDKELWHRVTLDDSRAFHLIYDRHWKKIYSTCCYYIKDTTAAEEITHDVFVTLWTRRKFLNIENFQNYLYMTARYHVFRFLKAARVDCIEYVDEQHEHCTERCYNLADQKMESKDLELQLAEILSELPRRCQEIFWLSRVEHLSNNEIAGKLAISKRTVENQITIALKHLRGAYAQSEYLFPCFLLLVNLLW